MLLIVTYSVTLSSVGFQSLTPHTKGLKPRTKVRNLMRLGVPVQAAVACGITRKGPWRSAKMPGINQALSLDYLKSEGLYSLREGWAALYSVRTRPQGAVVAEG